MSDLLPLDKDAAINYMLRWRVTTVIAAGVRFVSHQYAESEGEAEDKHLRAFVARYPDDHDTHMIETIRVEGDE